MKIFCTRPFVLELEISRSLPNIKDLRSFEEIYAAQNGSLVPMLRDSIYI